MSAARSDHAGVAAPESLEPTVSLLDPGLTLLAHWKLLFAGALAIGLLTLALTFLTPPRYTARTTFMYSPPQQNTALPALPQLGGLGALTDSAAGPRRSADQLVSLMRSALAEDSLVDKHDLAGLYHDEFRAEARQTLRRNTRMTVGKKDGLISIEVNDVSPQRAAELANQYVQELRQLLGRLVVTEAHQRRAYFDGELRAARDRLAQAQGALQASGFRDGVLRADPNAATQGYARLKAEISAAEVQLRTLRSSLTDTTPEARRQSAMLVALRKQLANYESADRLNPDADYLDVYREFKYQEALFEIFSRQYEAARLDETREEPQIQVVDVATPPETHSWPKRGRATVTATVLGFVAMCGFVLQRASWRSCAVAPRLSGKLRSLRIGASRQASAISPDETPGRRPAGRRARTVT